MVTFLAEPEPPKIIFAFGTSDGFDEFPARVKLAAGVSTSPIVKGIALVGVSSFMVLSVMSEIVGKSGTELTVNRKESLAMPPLPSDTVKVIVVVPNWLGAGEMVTVLAEPVPPKEMLLFGTSAVLEEVPDTDKLPSGVSISVTVKGIAGVEVSSAVLLSVRSDIVGRSFTELTFRTNVSSAVPLSPSVTVSVMVVDPFWFAAGMIVTSREESAPPNMIFPFGTREVLDEVPERDNSLFGVSVSPTVKGMAGVGVSSIVALSVISEIVGRSLTAVTVRRKVSLAELLLLSVTVTVMVVEPVRFEAGVIVTLREEPDPPKEMLLFGTRAVLDDEPETDKTALESSTSETVKGIAGVAVSSFVLLSVMLDIAGGSLTGMTVSRKVSLVDSPSPSVTVMVIVAEPNSLAAGVTVTVRLDLFPPKVIFSTGTRMVSEDEPVIDNAPTGVSASPT